MTRITMRAVALAATALGSLALALPAAAQLPLTKEPVKSILQWSEKEQLERYPAMEKTFRMGKIPAGTKVRELPMAAQQVDPKITFKARPIRSTTS